MRLIRCNRCGVEHETPMPAPHQVFPLVSPVAMPAWSKVIIAQTPSVEGARGPSERYDLCEDCREVFLLQFMVGATVAPITKAAALTPLPHDPMTDCQLVWNPGKGELLCYHDDPELYHALILDNAQNVVDKTGWVTCTHGIPCGCTSAEGLDNNQAKCTCPCHLAFGHLAGTGNALTRKVRQIHEDMSIAAATGARVQRCKGDACSEQHTYLEGCLLAGVVQPPSADKPDPDELVTCLPIQGGCGDRIPRHAVDQHNHEEHGFLPAVPGVDEPLRTDDQDKQGGDPE